MVHYDDLAPFRSNKIRATILDFGYGGDHNTRFLKGISTKNQQLDVDVRIKKIST